MTKRSHKNTRRLTARERAEEVVKASASQSWGSFPGIIERALQAHAREAVARFKRRGSFAEVLAKHERRVRK